MRKLVASTLALMMILSMFAFIPAGYAASDLTVVQQEIQDSLGGPQSQITEGETFDFKIVVQNLSGTTRSATTVTIDQSNFAVVGGVTTYSLGELSNNEVGQFTVKLKHNGGSSNTLAVSLNATELGSAVNQTLTIPMKKDSSTGGSGNVDTTKIKPVINIVEPESMEYYASTIAKPFKVNLDSINAYQAENVKVEITGGNELPFRRETSELSKTIDVFAPKSSRELAFKVDISPVAQSKVYEVPIKVTYENQYGDVFTVNETRFIKVANFEVEPTLSVVDFKTGNAELNSFTGDVLKLTVLNSGTREASDIRVTLTGFASDGILLNKDVPTKTKYVLGADQEATFEYSIHTNEIKASSTVTLQAKIDYIDELGKTYSQQYPVYVNVKSKDDKATEGSRPKPIVASYNYGGDYAMAGEEFILTVDIKNTSKTTAVRNAKVTFESEDNVFTPVNSSNSVFVDYIPADGVATTSIPLKTKIDANVKIYKVTVTAEYEDGEGNAYDSQKQAFKESETLSVAVAQPTRLEFADPILPWDAQAGRPISIEQEFFNMGKSTMYNMMVKLEGNFETNEGTYFVGNFDAGRSEYYSATVNVFEPGEVQGKIIFTYEDALGQQNSVEKEFSFTVNEAQEPDFNGGDFGPQPPVDPMNPEGESNNGWMMYAGIGAAVVALIIVIVVVRKRIRAKREREFLEADDE